MSENKDFKPYIPAEKVTPEIIYSLEDGGGKPTLWAGAEKVAQKRDRMKLVKDGGFLATCSCSHFMDYELFTKTIGQAAKNVHKRLRQVEYRTQAPDHPILWAADESYYLKFYIFQVCNDR